MGTDTKSLLITAIAKLRWAKGGEWSTSLTPQECEALLTIIPEDVAVIKGTTDSRQLKISGEEQT